MNFRNKNNSQPGVLKTTRLRLIFIKVILLIAFIGIIVRLVQIQIFRSSDLSRIAKSQYESRVTLPASRGNIYDRNGNILVSNTMEVSVYIDPEVIAKDSVPSLITAFTKFFGGNRKYYQNLLCLKSNYVLVKKKAPIEVKKFFREKRYYGVIIVDEPKRLYHYGSIASQLLGGITADTIGAGGVERSMNNELKGVDGYMILQRNGKGETKATIDYPRVEPVNGNDIYLTIDLTYQSIAEKELQTGVEKFGADVGIVVMLKPNTGEVLAITQYPSFNPNNILASDSNNLRIRAVTDVVEPGSVFKIVTASVAIEKKLVVPEQRFFAENGTYKVIRGRASRVINDHAPHGFLSFREALEQSSNIVFAKISDIIGEEALYTQARNFGFGNLTNIELPVEATGVLSKPSEWSAFTLNTMAYGYEVSATPLQVAAAYAAIANDGVLMKPFLLKKIVNEKNITTTEVQPTTVRRVVSSKTASTLKEFLKGVIVNGTAKAAAVDGLNIAGKTGTARQFIDKTYSHKKYFASFVGFYPVEEPQVVCMVILDNPKHGGYTGGTTSAPIFHNITNKICTVKGLHNRTNEAANDINKYISDEIVVPDVCNLQYSVGRKILESQQLITTCSGEGKVIMTQNPKPGTITKKGAIVTLTINNHQSNIKEQHRTVPNVVGLPLRRAINRLEFEGFDTSSNGNGIVTSQSPEAGVIASEKTIVCLICENSDGK
jgi:cell division protein FtsI/penicillin-binding protein 2